MQMLLDKCVFNVGKDLVNFGGLVMDVLDNVFLVIVDVEGNVSLCGSGGVCILINGWLLSLVGVGDIDGLCNIFVNLIEWVEVIINFSFWYEVEGMVGIINIIFKKEKCKGWNGLVDIIGGYLEQVGLAININYCVKKWNFFVNYGLIYWQSFGSGSCYQEVYDCNEFGLDMMFIQDLIWDCICGGWDNNICVGVDYSFSEISMLIVNFIYSVEDGDNILEIIYCDFINSLDNFIGISICIDNEWEEEVDLEYVMIYCKEFKGKGYQFIIDICYQDSEELEMFIICEAYFILEFEEIGVSELEQWFSNLEL